MLASSLYWPAEDYATGTDDDDADDEEDTEGADTGSSGVYITPPEEDLDTVIRKTFGGSQPTYGGHLFKFGGTQPQFGGPQSKFGGPKPKFGGPRPHRRRQTSYPRPRSRPPSSAGDKLLKLKRAASTVQYTTSHRVQTRLVTGTIQPACYRLSYLRALGSTAPPDPARPYARLFQTPAALDITWVQAADAQLPRKKRCKHTVCSTATSAPYPGQVGGPGAGTGRWRPTSEQIYAEHVRSGQLLHTNHKYQTRLNSGIMIRLPQRFAEE